MCYASRAMRSVIVDTIRKRQAGRHGGSAIHVALSDQLVNNDALPGEKEILRMHEALDDLAKLDPRMAQVGIAKLLEQGNAIETELTQLGGRALTPNYASPEQISGEPVGIASDVYSLGVVLYELLTGTQPFRLLRNSRAALEEVILRADPVRPSETASERLFRKTLRGDLEVIALKALKKKPHERYSTVNAFAEDIHRFLQGRPVFAQPDNTWYRLSKSVGRNKLLVRASATALSALLLGSGLALWQARVAQVVEKHRGRSQGFRHFDFSRRQSLPDRGQPPFGRGTAETSEEQNRPDQWLKNRIACRAPEPGRVELDRPRRYGCRRNSCSSGLG
jgi:serine/threonine protein kinase